MGPWVLREFVVGTVTVSAWEGNHIITIKIDNIICGSVHILLNISTF